MAETREDVFGITSLARRLQDPIGLQDSPPAPTVKPIDVDNLSSLALELFQGGFKPEQINRTVQQRGVVQAVGPQGEPPGFIENTLKDGANIIAALGTLIGQTAIEGVFDPGMALLRGEPGKAADEFMEAIQGGIGFAKQVPGAIVEGFNEGILGSLVAGRFREAGERFHERPVTGLLDASLIFPAIGAPLRAAGALSKVGSLSRAGRALSAAGVAVDPFVQGTRLLKGGLKRTPVIGEFFQGVFAERELLKRTAGFEAEAVRDRRALINQSIMDLHRLSPEERLLARDVAEGVVPRPDTASNSFNKAIDNYVGLFGKDGEVTKFMSSSGFLDPAEMEFRNWKMTLARRGEVDLDTLKKANTVEDLSPFIENVRIAMGDEGFNPAYVTYMMPRSGFRKMSSWFSRAFGRPGEGGLRRPQTGILKRNEFINFERNDFVKDLRDALIVQSKDIDVLTKYRARLDALANDPSSIAINTAEIMEKVIGKDSVSNIIRTRRGGQEVVSAIKLSSGETISLNQLAQRFEEVIGGKLQGRAGEFVLISPGQALNIERGARGAMKGLVAELSKGVDLEEAIRQSILRIGGKGAKMGIKDLPPLVAIKAEFAEAFERSLPFTGTTETFMRTVFDRPLDFFRKFWLGLSPGWVLNTIVGNALFSTLAMGPGLLNPINYYRALAPKWRKVVPPEVEMSIFREMTPETLMRTGSMAEKVGMGRLASFRELGGKMITPFFKVSAAIDDFFRRMVYVRNAVGMASKGQLDNVSAGWMRTLFDHDAAFQTVQRVGKDAAARRQVVESVTNWFGDYNNLTKWERGFIRRVVPFW